MGCSETVFVKEGFRNWKKAVGSEGKLEKHSKSRMHQLSRERAIYRKTCVPINAQLSAVAAENISRKQQERKENREVAEVIFDVVRHLILQNEAFRGHDEKDSSLNQGKFLAEIKFLAKYHPPLQKWLDTHPGNVSWISPDIQNEMIEILANHILDIIKIQVQESKYYSVECDEITSHKHSYMSIVLRYVFNNVIYERVIGLKKVVSLTGKSLCDVLVQELGKLQIPLCNMVGKGFDGASNMSGKEKGMQQQLTDAGATLSLYFHCFAHCLNLVLEKCAETLQPVKDVFSTIGAIYKVMEGSPQRNAVYERKLELFSIKDGRTALRAFSDTRWTAKADNLNATINTLPALIATLEELKSSDATCEGLLNKISSFEFLLQLLILKEFFEFSRYASEYLQREEMDLVTAVDAVTSLIAKFSSFRNEEKFAEFVRTAESKAVEFHVEDSFRDPSNKRRRTLPNRLADGQTLLDASFSHHVASSTQNSTTVSSESKFRTDFYYCLLDLLLTELKRRFSVESCEVLVQFSAFNPARWSDDNREKVRNLARRYTIPEEATCREYSLFRESGCFRSLMEEMETRKKQGWKNPYLPLILKKFGESDHAGLYPNLYRIICIAATIPVTIASCERCHSKVKIINNYMRATMGEDRLESLVLVSSERDVAEDIKLDSLVDIFALKPRKLPL